MFKAFLAAVIGTVVLFAWNSVSYMVLPFHRESFSEFSNPEAVAAAIKAGADKPGVYMIPGHSTGTQEELMQAFNDGPYFFGSVRPGSNESWSYPKAMLRTFTANLVAAILLAIILGAAAPRLNYLGRVFLVVLVGLFAGIVGPYQKQIWYEFTTGFTLLDMIDLAVGWGLAGLVMAGMINGRSAGAAE